MDVMNFLLLHYDRFVVIGLAGPMDVVNLSYYMMTMITITLLLLLIRTFSYVQFT